MRHGDFIEYGLSLHALVCEAGLLVDNLARMVGVSVADSIALTHW